MPEFTVDLTEAVSFKPLPEGVYLCEVDEIGDAKRGPKSSYFPVTLVVSEGEHSGGKLFTNVVFTGKAAGMAINFINAITGSSYDVDDLEELKLDTDDLVGGSCGAVTTQKEYPEGSGEFKSNVERVISTQSAKARIAAAE